MKSFSLQFPWKLPHLRHGPKTLKTACLLRKRTPLSSNYVPDYVGFEIPGNDTPSVCWYFFHLQCFLNQLPSVCNVSCCRQWEKFSLAVIIKIFLLLLFLLLFLRSSFQTNLLWATLWITTNISGWTFLLRTWPNDLSQLLFIFQGPDAHLRDISERDWKV